MYTHMKYNMRDIAVEKIEVKQDVVEIDKITPDLEGTKIYSDGSAQVEEKRGACAAIVSTAGQHIASSRSLHNDQAKNLYRTELERLYLDTMLAAGAGRKDRQWEYWCDSRAAITQCGKKYITTKDMVAPEADVILSIRHQLTASGKEGIFHHVRGHQDENRRFSELDKEAKYNVLCD